MKIIKFLFGLLFLILIQPAMYAMVTIEMLKDYFNHRWWLK